MNKIEELKNQLELLQIEKLKIDSKRKELNSKLFELEIEEAKTLMFDKLTSNNFFIEVWEYEIDNTEYCNGVLEVYKNISLSYYSSPTLPSNYVSVMLNEKVNISICNDNLISIVTEGYTRDHNIYPSAFKKMTFIEESEYYEYVNKFKDLHAATKISSKAIFDKFGI